MAETVGVTSFCTLTIPYDLIAWNRIKFEHLIYEWSESLLDAYYDASGIKHKLNDILTKWISECIDQMRHYFSSYQDIPKNASISFKWDVLPLVITFTSDRL